jgi:hypothetical protein
MTTQQAMEIAQAVLLAVGGGGLIVLALSSWLGKVWATRLMDRERREHDREMASLSAELRRQVDTQLANSRNELDIFKEKHLKAHADKLSIYRAAIDLIAEILGDLDFAYMNGLPLPDAAEQRDKMNRGRMRVWGYMAMLAPQHVMDSLDALFDHLLLVIDGHEQYEWVKVRELSLKLLNEVRKDIGIDSSSIEYRGDL